MINFWPARTTRQSVLLLLASLASAGQILTGCATTEINVSKPDGTKIQGSWQSGGDTSRTYSDCRAGAETCLIYVEATESEDIAPIIESIVGGLVEIAP